MHPGFSAGEIAAGALANLVVWDTSHPSFWPAKDPFRGLAMADTSLAIHAMYVMGREVGVAGDFHRSVSQSEGCRAAVAEASERLEALLARL